MKGFVYILTNKNNSVLYTGVTSNLKERELNSISIKNIRIVSLPGII